MNIFTNFKKAHTKSKVDLREKLTRVIMWDRGFEGDLSKLQPFDKIPEELWLV